MICVKTYLKQGENFVPFQIFNGAIKNQDYIDGAIELTANDVELLNISIWDYVDQLWAYLIQGLITVYRGETFTTYFPDQPIEITFSPIFGDKVKINVRCEGDVSVVIDKNELAEVIVDHATTFFTFLISRVPENERIYNELISELATL